MVTGRYTSQKQRDGVGQEPFVIERGERIAQLLVARHEQIQWESRAALEETVRGEGGFGSTG